MPETEAGGGEWVQIKNRSTNMSSSRGLRKQCKRTPDFSVDLQQQEVFALERAKKAVQ